MKDDPIKSEPVFYQVNAVFLLMLNNLLVDARENSAQLLIEHDEALGRTTRKNKILAELYEKEANELDYAITEIKRIIN